MVNNSDDAPFSCSTCGREFSLPAATRKKFPGWAPSKCPACFKKGGPPAKAKPRRPRQKEISSVVTAAKGNVMTFLTPGPLVQEVSSPSLEEALAEILARYTEGPTEGIFTDGACSGNPGPGGWGTVMIRGGAIVGRAYGREAHTTNNRMELQALIAGFRMLGSDDEMTLWSDSQLCVNTINTWAAAWERRGWMRKGGAVKNLDLVKEAYQLSRERPRATLTWIKAHNGSLWNEYVDTLATTPV